MEASISAGFAPSVSVSVHKSALVCTQLEASKKLSGVWLQGAGQHSRR